MQAGIQAITMMNGIIKATENAIITVITAIIINSMIITGNENNRNLPTNLCRLHQF